MSLVEFGPVGLQRVPGWTSHSRTLRSNCSFLSFPCILHLPWGEKRKLGIVLFLPSLWHSRHRRGLISILWRKDWNPFCGKLGSPELSTLSAAKIFTLYFSSSITITVPKGQLPDVLLTYTTHHPCRTCLPIWKLKFPSVEVCWSHMDVKLLVKWTLLRTSELITELPSLHYTSHHWFGGKTPLYLKFRARGNMQNNTNIFHDTSVLLWVASTMG